MAIHSWILKKVETQTESLNGSAWNVDSRIADVFFSKTLRTSIAWRLNLLELSPGRIRFFKWSACTEAWQRIYFSYTYTSYARTKKKLFAPFALSSDIPPQTQSLYRSRAVFRILSLIAMLKPVHGKAVPL